MSPLETLITKIKSLSNVKQRCVAALVGATVGDAATRPLHWIYNQETLDDIIKDTKETEFWPNSMCPFYTIPLGHVSAYNDTMLVSLDSLNQTQGELDVKHLCESFKNHFGPGTDYAEAHAQRGQGTGPVPGPWVQSAMLKFLDNYKEGKAEVFGGAGSDQYDGFCAALPIIAVHAGKADMWSKAEQVVNVLSTNSEAIRVFHVMSVLVGNYILEKADPIAETKEAIQELYPEVYTMISQTEGVVAEPYIPSVAGFGKACSIPGSFQGALLALLHTSSFVDAVRLNISAGGCNCSRGNLIGACLGAKWGIDGIPMEWLSKVKDIEKTVEQAINLVDNFGKY